MGPGPESIIKPCGKKEYFNRKNQKTWFGLTFFRKRQKNKKIYKVYRLQGTTIDKNKRILKSKEFTMQFWKKIQEHRDKLWKNTGLIYQQISTSKEGENVRIPYQAISVPISRRKMDKKNGHCKEKYSERKMLSSDWRKTAMLYPLSLILDTLQYVFVRLSPV